MNNLALDHNQLDQNLLDEYEQKIKLAGNTAIFEIGRLLIEFKKQAGHGNWLPLLDRLDMAPRRAQEYVSAYVLEMQYKDVSGSLSSILSQSAILLLASGETPLEVRDKVITEASEGRHFRIRDIEALIHEAKGVPELPPPTPATPKAPAAPAPEDDLAIVKAYLVAKGWWDEIVLDAKAWHSEGRPKDKQTVDNITVHNAVNAAFHALMDGNFDSPDFKGLNEKEQQRVLRKFQGYEPHIIEQLKQAMA